MAKPVSRAERRRQDRMIRRAKKILDAHWRSIWRFDSRGLTVLQRNGRTIRFEGV